MGKKIKSTHPLGLKFMFKYCGWIMVLMAIYFAISGKLGASPSDKLFYILTITGIVFFYHFIYVKRDEAMQAALQSKYVIVENDLFLTADGIKILYKDIESVKLITTIPSETAIKFNLTYFSIFEINFMDKNTDCWSPIIYTESMYRLYHSKPKLSPAIMSRVQQKKKNSNQSLP